MRRGAARWRGIGVVGVLAVLAATLATSGPATASEGPLARLVAGWHDTPTHVGVSAVRSVAEQFDGTLDLVEPVLGFAVAEVPAASADEALGALAAHPDLAWAEPDEPLELHYLPNDTFWWAQWGPPAIGVPEVWDTGFGSHARKVAVIDTGVEATHPDLAPNACEPGENYLDSNSPPNDTHGHGTHVAGTVAAQIDNARGVAGMGNSCIVPIKVIDGHGNGSTAYLASGITWAADNGVHVANMSLGSDSGTIAVDLAVEYAWGKGMLMVASAGNDFCTAVGYPAAYPEVIAVAALDTATTRASYSDCGPEVELAAPGSTIASTDLNGSYSYKSGTSMASPHVAGVAALLWDRQPGLTNAQMRCLLRDTADDLGPDGRDDQYGWGRVDADGALDRMLQGGVPAWPTCGAPPPPPGDTRTETQTYLAGNDLIVQCTLNVGGACFDLQPSDATVSIALDDIFVDTVGGVYRFRDASGAQLARETFCQGVENVAVPAGAADLVVFAGGPSRGLLDFGSPTRAATAGFIDVTFNP